jgi:hypothetical protein
MNNKLFLKKAGSLTIAKMTRDDQDHLPVGSLEDRA